MTAMTADRTTQTMGMGRPPVLGPHSPLACERGVRGSALPIWLPWLAAPMFMLMPMGGCAVASRIRQAAVNAVAVPVREAPVATVVTAARD